MLRKEEPNDRDGALSGLRGFIAESGFEAGQKLPSERNLTDRLGISRGSLRKALDELEREGTIWRHVGKGTFVSGPADAEAPDTPPAAKIGRHLTPFRMMRARLAIEPAIAREAAMNMSSEALARMEHALEHSRKAQSWQAYEQYDDLFHRAIAEGSDNLLLLSIFEQLNQVRREIVWGTVTRHTPRPSEDHFSFEHHDRIAAAISGRDPVAAYEAMRTHLRAVSAWLFRDV